MTVSTTTSVAVAQGNGVTTIFPFSFKVLDEEHLVVQRRVRTTSAIDLTYPVSAYTVSGIGDDAGEITFTTAPASTYDIIISRVVEYTQELDIVNQGGFYPETAEAQLDLMVMQTQQIAADVGRTLKASIGETLTELPSADVRAGKFLVFDADGDVTTSSGSGADGALRTDLAGSGSLSLIAHPAGGTLGTYLGKIKLTPREFGATGAIGDDQDAEMQEMMVAARDYGRAHILLEDGDTYTYTNPFLWGGLRELVIEGYGAKLMNFRTVSDVSDVNLCAFRNPVPMLTNGIELYVEDVDMGFTIATAEAGATTITGTSGNPTVGWAWAFGWDRYGDGGFPTTSAYFEPIYIKSVVGAVGTLATPLLHRYDAAAPETTISGTPQAGAGRVIMLDRPTGTYEANVWMDKLTVLGVEMIENPGLTNIVNGLAGFGGARMVHLEDVKAPKASMTLCDSAYLKRFICTGDFEVDKMVGEFIADDCEFYNLLGGLGCKIIRIRNGTRVRNNMQVAPLELLDLSQPGGLRLNAMNSVGNRYLIGNYAYGSRETVIDSPIITVSNPTTDRVFEGGKFDWTPTITSTTQFTSSRAAFDASNWQQALRIGTIVYASNLPVAEITRMPWVPAGSLLTGDVAVGYKLLGGAIAPATVLSLSVFGHVEVRSEPILEGTYARQVQSMLGVDVTTVGAKLGRIRGPNMTETEITVTSKMSEYDPETDNAFMLALGSGFRVRSIEFDVTRAASSGGAVALFIGADEVDGSNIGILTGLDLKTVGARTLTGTTLTGLAGADVVGGAGYGIPADPICTIRWTDAGRGLAEGSRGAWRMIFKGYYL